MVVSSKTDLRFPESGQQGHGARIIQLFLRNTLLPKMLYPIYFAILDVYHKALMYFSLLSLP